MSIKLIFEGLIEETDEGLRKLKATFISELDFSVEETISILENCPCELKEVESEEELTSFIEVLEKAGAKFSIVEEEDEPEEEEEVLIEFNLDEDEEPQRIDTSKVREKGKVYKIPDLEEGEEKDLEEEQEESDIIDEADVDDLVKQLETSVQVEKSKHPTLEEIARPRMGQFEREKDASRLEIESSSKEKNEEEQQQPEPQPEETPEEITKKTKRKLHIPDEILITIFVSAFMLAVGAYMLRGYFKEQITNLESYRKKVLQAEKEEAEKEKLKLLEEEKIIFEAQQYAATDTNQERQILLSCSIYKNKVTSITFTLTTPEPPPLTDLEIVSNIPERSWLEHMKLTDDFVLVKNSAEDFLAKGSVKAFIRHQKIKTRFQGRVVITGKYDKTSDTVSVELLINRGYKEIPDTNFLFERISERNHAYFLREKLTLQKVEKE